MSLFGEQLKTRLRNDNAAVVEGERLLSDTLSAKSAAYDEAEISGGSAARQMTLIARYFQLEKPNVEDRGQTDDEVVEEVMRATNMTKRSVRLTDAWWKDSDGPLLATLRDGSGTLALFPGTVWGLYFLDATTNKKIRVTKKRPRRTLPYSWALYSR